MSLTAKISKSGLSSSFICIDASVRPSPGIKLLNMFEISAAFELENDRNKNIITNFLNI